MPPFAVKTYWGPVGKERHSSRWPVVISAPGIGVFTIGIWVGLVRVGSLPHKGLSRSSLVRVGVQATLPLVHICIWPLPWIRVGIWAISVIRIEVHHRIVGVSDIGVLGWPVEVFTRSGSHKHNTLHCTPLTSYDTAEA